MKQLLCGLLCVVVLGCNSSTPSTTTATKTITWDEFKKMPSEDQADPYVLNNLDEAARKKFEDMIKKQKK
jgi:hypothetical protein